MPITKSDGGISVTGEKEIALVQMMTQASALRLEIRTGMRHSRVNVYAAVKQQHGFTGNKRSVLRQLDAKIAEMRKESV